MSLVVSDKKIKMRPIFFGMKKKKLLHYGIQSIVLAYDIMVVISKGRLYIEEKEIQ